MQPLPQTPPFYDPNMGPGYCPVFNGMHTYNPTNDPGLNLLWDTTQATQDVLTQQAMFTANMPPMYGPMGPGPGMAPQGHGEGGGEGATGKSHGRSILGHLGFAASGAAIGAAAGLFLPGGPAIGAAVGGTLGLISSFF